MILWAPRAAAACGKAPPGRPCRRPASNRALTAGTDQDAKGQGCVCQTGAGRLARTRQPGIPDRRESARAVPTNAAPWRSAAQPVGDRSTRSAFPCPATGRQRSKVKEKHRRVSGARRQHKKAGHPQRVPGSSDLEEQGYQSKTASPGNNGPSQSIISP